jgi:CelD/BcsL family acetyltransferase involved in cellulose biosynthesis
VQTEFAELTEALTAEWWQLWHASSTATVFQSPAWLVPWAAQFGGGKAHLLVIRNAGALVALVPLYRHEGRWLPWGAGTSDWLDGIFAPHLDPTVLTGAMAGLDTPIDLFQVPAGSPLLAASAPAGWSDLRRDSAPCVVLPLPAQLPDNMAQNLRYYRRRAERAGIGVPERLGPEAFDEFVALHSLRWRAAGDPGVLADPKVLAWHRATLPRLAEAGLLRFYGLRQDGRLVAALYALSGHGRTCYYLGGFDPALAALGLGTVLVGHAISEAEREGAKVFDFLRGQEAYKYRWGAADVRSYARLLSPP